MWMAASGISENRPCLAFCKFTSILHQSVSQSWDAVFNLSYTDEHPTNIVTLITQCDNRAISWYSDTCKGKHWNLVSLTYAYLNAVSAPESLGNCWVPRWISKVALRTINWLFFLFFFFFFFWWMGLLRPIIAQIRLPKQQ